MSDYTTEELQFFEAAAFRAGEIAGREQARKEIEEMPGYEFDRDYLIDRHAALAVLGERNEEENK